MATFKYKVRAGDTPTTLASKFKTSPQAFLKANPGVSKLSQGMTIKIPSTPLYKSVGFQPVAPFGVQPKPPVIGGPPQLSTFQKAVFALTGNQYSKPAGPPAPPPPPVLGQPHQVGVGPGNKVPVPTSSYGQLAAFRKASSAKYNTVSIQNNDGTVTTQPRTVGDGAGWTSEIAKLAVSSGMSRDQIRQDLQAQGYVQYGNQWIYNAPASGTAAGGEEKKRAWYGFRGDKWRINKKTGQVYSVAKNNGQKSGNKKNQPQAPAAAPAPNSDAKLVTWRV